MQENLAKNAGVFFKPGVVNAFTSAVGHTVKSTTKYQVTIGKPSIENDFSPKGDLAGCVTMTAKGAPITCKMTVSFRLDTACFILYKIIGMKETEMCPAVLDAAGEITNMIYGQARKLLNEQGYDLSMALPVIAKSAAEIKAVHGNLALVIPFFIRDNMPFWVEISVSS